MFSLATSLVALSIGSPEPVVMAVPPQQAVLLNSPTTYASPTDGWVCADGVCRRVAARVINAVSPAPATMAVPTQYQQTTVTTTEESGVLAQRRFTPARSLLQRVRGFGSRLFGRGCH